VVLGGSGRRRPEATSPFDSLTPILYRLPIDSFCLFLTVEKLFDLFSLAGNSHRDLKSWGFWGITAPKNYCSKITSKRHLFTPNRVI
jgi:hypothetical protein